MTVEKFRHFYEAVQLSSDAKRLVSTTGVFLGIPMREDPELSDCWDPISNDDHRLLLKRIFYISANQRWDPNSKFVYDSYYQNPNNSISPELVVTTTAIFHCLSNLYVEENEERRAKFVNEVRGLAITQTVCLLLEYVKMGKLEIPSQRLYQEEYLTKYRKSVKII